MIPRLYRNSSDEKAQTRKLRYARIEANQPTNAYTAVLVTLLEEDMWEEIGFAMICLGRPIVVSLRNNYLVLIKRPPVF